MATPWVILSRVLRAGFIPGAVEAESEVRVFHAAAVDADVRAQAMEEPVAVVEAEAEDEKRLGHTGAVDADVQEKAQEKSTAAVEAEDEARPQKEPVAAVEEEEEMLAGEVAVAVGAKVEHAAAAAEPDFILPVALPPRVTVLTAGRGAYPDPDECPYIVAANSSILLVRFAAALDYSSGFDDPSNSRHVVVRDFRTNGDQMTASAELVARRTDRAPILRSSGNVVLHSIDATHYMIGDLRVHKGSDHATLVYLRSDGRDGWCERPVRSPLAAHDREWIPHGAVSVDGALWWFDLSWGILSYGASLAEPELVFHHLPEGRALDDAAPVDIHTKRCVAASGNKLWFVEIIAEGEAPSVSMWSRSRGLNGEWHWDAPQARSFEEIWDDASYNRTGLARNVPVLAVVCPSDPEMQWRSYVKANLGLGPPLLRRKFRGCKEPRR